MNDTIWFFTYDLKINESTLKKKNIKVYDTRTALLNGYSLEYDTSEHGKTIPKLSINVNNYVEGISYKIDKNDLNKLNSLFNLKNYEKNLVQIKFKKKYEIQEVEAVVYINNKIRNLDVYNSNIPKMNLQSRTNSFAPNMNGNSKFVMTFESFVYNLNENFITDNMNTLKFIFGVGAVSILGLLVRSYITKAKINISKNLIMSFDPVLKNKLERYEKGIISNFEKDELEKFYIKIKDDNVLKTYIKKINDSKSEDETRYLMKQLDNYIISSLSKEQYDKIKHTNYHNDQSNDITPNIVEKFNNKILKEFKKDLNSYLSGIDIQPIESFDIRGSSFYWREDIKENPSVRYGDVDVIVTYPLLNFNVSGRQKNIDEDRTQDIYNRFILEFINSVKPSYINTKITTNLNRNNLNRKLFSGLSISFIIDSKNEIVIDLIPTFSPYKQWTLDRFTPQHNIKGIVFGYLCLVIESVLKIDINNTGVFGYMTPKSKQLRSKKDGGAKNTINISKDTKTCMLDSAYWLGTLNNIDNNNLKIDPLLKKHKGFGSNGLNIEEFMLSLKGFILTLEENDIFKNNIIPEVYNKAEAINRIEKMYFSLLNRKLHDSHFNDKSDVKNQMNYQKTSDSILYAKETFKKIFG